MKPPFTITAKILTLVSEISRILGKYEGLMSPIPQPQLRRKNTIQTIQQSLAIEGNTLSLEQVSAIFDHKRVIGPKKDVLEVKNAIRLYEKVRGFNSTAIRDLLAAHQILMQGLVPDAGKLRSGSVRILKGAKVAHIAPPAMQVPRLIDDLFKFLKSDPSLSPLIKATVFHYELEFIHPFSDGNGRIGRFWQHLILMQSHPLFEFIPVESIIKDHQTAYYRALELSDKNGDSTVFIEFSLAAILEALNQFMAEFRSEPQTPSSRLEIARKYFNKSEFTRKDYLLLLKTLSSATASRDLALGVKMKQLKIMGTKALARYRFVA